MNVLIFGATGMVGQGVLRQCLLDPDVRRVLVIGRNSVGKQHEKLREIIRPDLMDLSGLESELTGLDDCFFCLGVTSVGLSEEQYTRITYDLTMSIVGMLARCSPGMTFIYVSGVGTDSSEAGSRMWARVKGRTENALLRMPFKAAYMFRPGVIIAEHGIRSRTTLYRLLYGLLKPFLFLMQLLTPRSITTTGQIGRAMLAAARRGYAKQILEPPDINSL